MFFLLFYFFLLRLRFGHITGAAETFSRCTSGLKEAKVCDSKEKRSSLGERENIDIHTVSTLSASSCNDTTVLMVGGAKGGVNLAQDKQGFTGYILPLCCINKAVNTLPQDSTG